MLKTNRYLVIASLIGCLAVVCLVLVYRQLALASLVEHETRSNAALTQVFSNSVWPNYRPLLEAEDIGVPGTMPPGIRKLDADVRKLMRGSDVVKVKIYDANGLTIYSSDPTQIGEDKGDNNGFLGAISGHVASNITYRGQFDAFEGRRSNLNVVSSYIPIRNADTNEPEAVFEVYSDVTGLVEAMRSLQWTILFVVLGSVAALYLLLVNVAWRVDRAEAKRLEEAARNEARIRHQAYHDPVTGLPNRVNFQNNLGTAFERAESRGEVLVVMFLDVDRFKLVNDSLGHDAGDALLRLIAARLRDCLRQTDALFRVGGDEFTVLPEGLSSREEAADLAQRVLDAMKAPFLINSRSIGASVSIGLSTCPHDDDEPEKLVKNADAAMYLAKKNGRNRFCFYTPDLDEYSAEQSESEPPFNDA